MLAQFFQILPIPADHIVGSYNLHLVLLSYLIAIFASYVALDIVGNLREINTRSTQIMWLLIGAGTMGGGIWAMHFVGLLAFSLPIPISHDPLLTALSLFIAVLASCFALLLLLAKGLKAASPALGGVLLGLGIVSMHYVGMEAMKAQVEIRYLPEWFLLSIFIAILASEVSLWLALKSNYGALSLRFLLKFLSAIFMGTAICGMQYSGMTAAVFIPLHSPLISNNVHHLNPESLAINVSIITFVILSISFIASTYKQIISQMLDKKNKELIAAQNTIQILNSTLEQRVEERTKELEQSLSYTQATLESTTDGILVVNLEGKQVGYNQRFVSMWHIPNNILSTGDDDIVLNFVLSQLLYPDKFLARVKELYHHPEAEAVDEIEFKNGRIFERLTQPQWQNGKVTGRVWSFRDITNRKRMEKHVEYQATHDLLTNLPNRTVLVDRTNQAISVASRFNKLLAIVLIDVDRFKLINDGLGHNIGDMLLQQIALQLKKCKNEHDTLVRLGGDEFVIMLQNLENENVIISVVKKIRNILAKSFVIEGHELIISCSMGISVFPHDGNDAMELLKNADAAMYRAKELGRNNFQFYTEEINAQTVLRMELEHELRLGLERNEFLLHYQPIVNLKTGLIGGVEALLRWNSIKYGLISPQKFIPLAEEIGLMVPLGEWVLFNACKQLKEWQAEGYTSLHVSVNLSGKQLKQGKIVDIVTEVLKKTKLLPTYLELELTESIIMESSKEVIETMQALQKLGVRLAIDDFGTGYSSLSYLKRFPIDKLKIDKSFVDDLDVDPDDTAITLAIIALARALKLQVVAEGVETEQQLNFLKTHQCEEMQGFLFSRPLDARSCSDVLSKNLKHKDPA